MPHAQHHRGAHPEDPRLFAPQQLPKLRLAMEEAGWMLGRGYAPDSLADLVCRKHQLESRQKNALLRSMCAPQVAAQRRQRHRAVDTLVGQTLNIDGFNLIITLEVAISGGALFRGADGAIRDIAGLRGSYHPVEETDGALVLIGETLHQMGVARADFYLDAPVSNSGRLRARILEHACHWRFHTEAQTVPDPDRTLVGLDYVASSDGAVIDSAKSWTGLASAIVESRVPDAWLLDFSTPESARSQA